MRLPHVTSQGKHVSELPPANWYPDPEVPGQQRYWDGTQWTEHRAPAADTAEPGAAQPGHGQPGYGEQPGYGQPGYGQPAYAPSGPGGRTSGMAITSLVVAIVSFFLAFIAVGALGGIVAVVLGIIALRQIRESHGTVGGKGVAIGGIVVGGLSILIGAALVVLFAFVGSVFEQNQGTFTDFFECMEQAQRTGEDLNC